MKYALDKDGDTYAPYVVKKDSDYYDDLRKRYTRYIKTLQNASADEKSISIVRKYSDKVCEAIREYYRGNISSCHMKIENLVKNCSDNVLAVSTLENSKAFPGDHGLEIQFFRARTSQEARIFSPKEMLHLPFSMRGKSGNYRFSIPGVTSLYLSTSSYGCWIEMGRPPEHDFNVSPVVLDGKQRIFNLAVMTRDGSILNDGEEERVHCWLKLIVLMIATSYRVEEAGRTFKSEYIVPQSIMLACKKLGYDGVAYYSKQVADEMFSIVAINLALFADYKKGREYGPICEHIKVGRSMNYQMFRQLGKAIKDQQYELRVNHNRWITNIGDYKRQYTYRDTEFYKFDQHLFSNWAEKDDINWGNAMR